MTAAKKFILVSVTTGLCVVMTICSFVMLHKANDAEVNACKNQYEAYLLADEMRQSSDDLTRLVRLFTVTRDEHFLEQYQAILDIRNGKKARPRDYHKIYWDFVTAGEKKPQPDTAIKISLLDLMKQAGFSKAEIDMLVEAGKRSNKLVESEKRAVEIVRQTSPDQPDFHEQMNKAQALVHNLQYHKDKADIMKAVDKFYTILEQRIQEQVVRAEETSTLWERGATVALFTLIAMLGVFAALFISILKHLGEDPDYLYSASNAIASGNLDFSFRGGQDKKGVYAVFCEMVSSMKEKIQEAQTRTQEAAEESRHAQESAARAEESRVAAEKVKKNILLAAEQLEHIVEIVSSASKQLSAQIEQSSHGADEQAQRVSETATAMQEMNGAVLEVARSAGQASELSTQVRKKAQAGAKIVKEAGDSMIALQEQSNTLKADMNKFEEHAASISRIMGVISDIADQTNLLALNAAIEAARAGEAGRGFAVVADEVRKLAEKTMASTADVSKAITEIQESASENIRQVERTGAVVEQVTEQSRQASSALVEIVAIVDESADQIRAIATASEEQSATSEEINRSVTEVNTISAETSQAMREAAQAVVELSRQTQELGSLIQQMKND